MYPCEVDRVLTNNIYFGSSVGVGWYDTQTETQGVYKINTGEYNVESPMYEA